MVSNRGIMRFRAIILSLFFLSVVAVAHHARFTYDDSKLVEVRGTVRSALWQNPHIRFTVSSVEGSQEELWEMEGLSVNAMERTGINSESFGVGDNVAVLGLLSVRDKNSLLPILMTTESGQKLVLSRDRARAFGLLQESTQPVHPVANEKEIELAIREANGIYRVWTNTGRTGSGLNLPLTDAARAAKESWNQPTDDIALLCEPAGMPEAMLSPFPIELLEQDDKIIARLEEWDNVRVIHMGTDGNVTNMRAPSLGYSVGRWENGTLIVRTTDINYPYLDDRGTPQSEAVEIIERFTLSEDETRLDWVATVVDPNTFTEPVTLPMMHWEWLPGEKIKPFNCTLDDD